MKVLLFVALFGWFSMDARAAYPALAGETPTVAVTDNTTAAWGLHHVDGQPITNTFQPTAEDLAGLTDPVIIAHLKGRTGRDQSLRQRLLTGEDPYRRHGGQYVRQVIGVEAGGKRWIFASYSYITAERDRDWTQRPVSVSDGGTDFFELFWSPADKTITGLMVHGEA